MSSHRFINRRFIRKIITRAYPMGQFEQSRDAAADEGDLGLGFVYYALARVLKPSQVVVVGSYRGFSVVCTALGLADNGKGRLHFIDAAVVDDFWTDRTRVREHFRSFGVSAQVTLHRTTTRRWLQSDQRARRGRPFIDLLLLDGDHTFRGVAFDYRGLGPLVKPGGYICLHDSFVGGLGFVKGWEVADFLSTLDVDLFEAVTFEIAQGLTIIKKLPRTVIPQSRIAGRKSLRERLKRLEHAGNGRGSIGISELRQMTRRTISDSLHLDRTLETRNRFLAKSNRDLRARYQVTRRELRKLRARSGQPSRTGR